MSHDETITIRTSRETDAGELLRLAALDSAEPIRGDVTAGGTPA